MSLYTKQLINKSKWIKNVQNQCLEPFRVSNRYISSVCSSKLDPKNRSDCLFASTNHLKNGKCCRYIHVSVADFKIQAAYDASVNIFDRKAKIIQRERAAKAGDVHLFDYVKEEVGWRLADRVFDIKKTFKNAVDLGCSRGYVARHLTPDSVEKITLCDTVQASLDQAQLPEGIEVIKMIADEETVEFPPDSLDLVISSLCLHWVNDLPKCFDNIMKALQNDGVFLATLFGEDTLFELRSSLQLADLERRGGLAAHISPFTRIRDIGGLLNRSGFSLQTIDTDEIVVGYPTMFELMTDLKGMGESNASFNRQLHLSRETQIAAATIYDEMYGKTNPDTNQRTIPATFQVIYLLGWKPDKSQRKPLSRGSGQISLKDLHRLDEVATKKGMIELDAEEGVKK